MLFLEGTWLENYIPRDCHAAFWPDLLLRFEKSISEDFHSHVVLQSGWKMARSLDNSSTEGH